MILNKRELIERVLVPGHCVLASGKHATCYLDDERLWSDSVLAKQTTDTLASLLGPHIEKVVGVAGMIVCVGLETGGVRVAEGVCQLLEFSYKVRLVIANKEGGKVALSPNALLSLRGKCVIVLDDTLTEGTTIRPVILSLKEAGAHVIAAGVIFNRGEISHDELGVDELVSVVSREELVRAGVDLTALSPEFCECRDEPVS